VPSTPELDVRETDVRLESQDGESLRSLQPPTGSGKGLAMRMQALPALRSSGTQIRGSKVVDLRLCNNPS